MKVHVRREKVKVAAVLLAVLAFLSACAGRAELNSDNAAKAPPPMRVVTDDLGRTVKVPAKVTRAVSLAPNLTESIFAVGAGDRLVGVTTFCNYPEQAKAIAKIGDTMNPNMESIVALKPDVVFVSTASQIETFTKTLEANGIAVYVTNPKTFDNVAQSLLRLGELFGTQEQAQSLVNRLEGRRSMITHLVSFVEPRAERKVPIKVFVQISNEPLFTIGKDSFVTDLIGMAYGVSVTDEIPAAYPKLSKETAIALQPEVIILSDSPDNQEPNEVFKNSPAVKNRRVYKINADIISRPGPRLVDALEQIAKDLYPENFS